MGSPNIRKTNRKIIERLIDQVGGTAAVAKHFKISRWAVRKWALCGLPDGRVRGFCNLTGAAVEEVRPDLIPRS